MGMTRYRWVGPQGIVGTWTPADTIKPQRSWRINTMSGHVAAGWRMEVELISGQRVIYKAPK